MKIKKIVAIIAIIFIALILFFNTTCMAEVPTDVYKPQELKPADYEEAFAIGGTIVSALKIIGTVIAIVGVMIMGIKYMIGSVEQKAEYKKTMIPYIIGCILIFAITRIVSIVYDLAIQL